ncbi:NAD(P)-dependent dehydrogenase (short-subunit alcohol dehydrogenase family) [Paenarthrobacter nitroguajacolicus]|uniref:SDR family NAD(P)-dependent oxidoreductase n=1 Tax=Paenarthrobacter nitroguajacolicus TaxID=211146 RepID=UPI0028634AB4|nr:SDR family NAD(P)-dependent oxidoreductase [Paenarthrobacter nitroguajacolicus]MDR6989184.1 NAD(P)-dependent dehydrogenase (short-subunit alcohol dehydrogenase family) [Paenarthrobacter nitroguajacolicus]
MTDITFDGRVAAITGAGNGLGRAYALELARRGAKVVVNDLGSSPSGEGSDDRVAHSVVDEIIANGGEAVAHFGDVASADDMQAMIDLAIQTWGRIDILVSNAGAPGGGDGKTFPSPDDWDTSLRVNLQGVVNPLRAAWPHFVAQNYGRVVNTSSSSMFGTPGVGAYQAAKAGVVGLTKVLASTYPDIDIKVNAVMPTAWSRMTERISAGAYRDWLHDKFQAELVAPFVAVLCHESLEVRGEVFTVGGGRAARVLFELTDGWWEEAPTAESFADKFDVVMSGNNPIFATSGQGDLARYVDWLGDPGVFPKEAVERARAGRVPN